MIILRSKCNKRIYKLRTKNTYIMMYIAEIDLKKKKRQLIPFAGYVSLAMLTAKERTWKKIVPLLLYKYDNIWH